MRLADFIVRNMEPILVQWEAFAATLLPAARNMNSLGLRDHAREILTAVAKDIATPQTRQAQYEKSLGRAPEPVNTRETAAQTHAVLRARGASTSTSWRPSIVRCAPACCACGSTRVSRARLIWTT